MATEPKAMNPAELVQIGAAPKPALALETAREKLTSATGEKYWRTLEELTNEKGFQELMDREFPRHAAEFTDSVSRRNFLKLASASLALAGLTACTKQPDEAIVPYVQQPEDLIPGKPIYYATVRPTQFGGQPLLVKTQTYRPVKLEGNGDHPYSGGFDFKRGATDVHSQASILDLYDPDRSQSVTYEGNTKAWSEFVSAMRDAMAGEKGNGGANVRFLTETVVSPSLAAQIQTVLRAYPQAKWYQYDGVNRDSARAGARMAFGSYVDAQYDLSKADVIVSLDADFLSGPNFPGFLKLSRDFASRRKLPDHNSTMSRLYVVESQMSVTGGKADNRAGMKAVDVEQFAGALAAAVGGGSGGRVLPEHKKFFDALVKDLQAARGRSVVIPGEQQSPTVHALAAAMNSALGNVGQTVGYTDTVELVPTEQVAGLRELVADMNAGRVKLLFVLGGNPVYTAPADLEFGRAMYKVAMRANMSMYRDETSRLCQWHVPMAHYLEAWGDARSYDGTVSVIQPAIEPLYGGKTIGQVFQSLSEQPGVTPYDAVRDYWKSQNRAADDLAWRRILHDGFVAKTAFAPRTMSARPVAVGGAPSVSNFEVVFRPDTKMVDGRFTNNGWLQELPTPITHLTWDNAIIMSVADAEKNGYDLKGQDEVELTVNGRTVKAPVAVIPGQPQGTLTVHLGYGRTNVGRVGTGTGFNAGALRTSNSPFAAAGATLKKTGEKWKLAVTSFHHLIDKAKNGHAVGESHSGTEAFKRDLVRVATLDEFHKNPHYANEGTRHAPDKSLSLYGTFDTSAEKQKETLATQYGDMAMHQWGMTIDMNSCINCSACVIACQAENNIPVVGKEEVLMGREMHWLRIDTYFATQSQADVANPRAYFQPIPCMQCENAPCEPVCPVGATVHSPEGLNNMAYNRCVGTRYCSNNCPYKVRRFNFLLYADFETESLKPMRNPDVSVRSRGVMEKCTYCVQRINQARIDAQKEDRRIRDGEVMTACQQTCPTDAITFGDVSDMNSKVVRLKKQERNYGLLTELNTRPRTTYIASVINPNAEAGAAKTETNGHA